MFRTSVCSTYFHGFSRACHGDNLVLTSIRNILYAGTSTSQPAASVHTSASRYTLYNSILDTIGRTPVVRANKVLPELAKEKNIDLYLKLEYFNPLGSVKDRLAFAMIRGAEERGELKPGMTVIEATSGNTGYSNKGTAIGLAMVCAVRGYPFVAVMVETYSVDRRQIMRALGAKVVLTPASGGGTGMIEKTRELAESHGWFWTRQFENSDNWRYHASTTGPEILCDFSQKRLDYWVTGYGTGGTFTGAGRVIKAGALYINEGDCAVRLSVNETRPEIKIILVEPDSAALLKSGITQQRHADGTPSSSHPAYSAHGIQGWTPNFIPKVCQDGVDDQIYDDIVTVSDADAIEMAHQLTQREGIFSGISSGATTAAACQIAATNAPPGSTILAMIPDTQERYQSTALFDHFPKYMTPQEIYISQSTSSFQMKDKAAENDD